MLTHYQGIRRTRKTREKWKMDFCWDLQNAIKEDTLTQKLLEIILSEDSERCKKVELLEKGAKMLQNLYIF
jgi:hypothetical protein